MNYLPPPSSADEQLAVRLQVLAELIDQEILLNRARARKVDVTAEEVEQAYRERRSNMSDEAFQQELDRRQLSVDAMKEALRRELVVQKLLAQEIGAKVTPTEQDVRDFYERNRARFNIKSAANSGTLIEVVFAPAAVGA